MKKFLKYLFIFCILISSVFIKNSVVSNEIVSAAISEDEFEFIAMFSDNENLEEIQSLTLTDSYFNVLDRVDYEFYDQSQYGTCYAFALAQMLNLSYEYKTGEHIRLSPLALALQFEDVFFSEGSYIYTIIQSSFDLDYVSEYDFPYELAKSYYDEKITTKELNLNFDGKEIIDVKEYYLFPDLKTNFSEESKNLFLQNMKKALVKDGSLMISLFDAVVTSGEYLIYEPTATGSSYHSLTVVGYDDNVSGSVFGHETDGAFIVMNSWGAEEQIIYVSYEDMIDFRYVAGVAGFIDFDERASSVSNIDVAVYGLENGLYAGDSVDGELEIGYLITNETKNSYLSEIDLKPLCRDIDIYGFAADIKLYVGASTQDLTNGSFEYVGDYDISGGVNKIVLENPIEVSKNFSIKIVITDEEHRFSFLDESNLNFSAYYNIQGEWVKIYYSNYNYDLIKTPYYVRTVFTNGKSYDISEEDNHQTNTANAVEFSLSSSLNTEIDSVGVEIFKHTSANASFTSFSMLEQNVTDDFNIVATTSSVKLTKSLFSVGTYKVVINVNNGEKQFIKFLFFDDGIDVFAFYSFVYYDIFENVNKLFSIHSNALTTGVVNITIPDAYNIYFVKNKAFIMEDIFNYNEEELQISAKYSIDTSERISKAEVIFKNIKTSVTRVVTLNFIYDKTNLIFYVTKLASATHSNHQTIDQGFGFYLTNASAPNHTFLGWYEDPGFVISVNKVNAYGSGQIIYLYARFEEKTKPSIVQKVTYDENSNIMTVHMDFSNYNLAIYDTLRFSGIFFTFKTKTLCEPFHLLKSALTNNKYEYHVYIEPENMKDINTIEFKFEAERWLYRGKYGYYDTLSQSVSITDKVKLSVVKNDGGKIYNSLTGDLIESGDVYLPYGGKLDLNFIPDYNHRIKRILVDGYSVIQTEEYCFSNLIENHTFEIEFELITYEISALVSGEGELDRGSIELVERGSSITYTFTAKSGYFLQSLQVDGVSLATDGVTSYTFYNVQENHSINIIFAPYSFTITATIIGSGSIGHPTENYVNYGDDAVYTFIASEGYHLKQVFIDNEEVFLANNNYTFNNVTSNHSIIVKFEKDVINVSISVHGNGLVRVKSNLSSTIIGTTKTEAVFVCEYEDILRFEFIGDTGYKTGSVRLNKTNYGSITNVTVQPAVNDIDIEVYFVVKTYNLQVNVTGSGVANLPTNIVKNHGESVEYIFTPSTGYEIQKVIIDGKDKGAINSYLFENINSDHVINVIFSIQSFKINWFNYSGTLITTTSVNYGILPTPTFSEPTRPADGNYVYDFVGWNSEIDGSGTDIVPATSDMNYYAQFFKHLVQLAIKVGVSTNGEIYPQGDNSHNVMVEYGKNQTFTFTPDEGYHVSKVYVDEKIVDELEGYTFENVTDSHTISVVFKKNDFKATIVSDKEKGEIEGSRWYENGERATFKIKPNDGYVIESVYVNGKSVSFANNTIIIENVNGDIEIVVNYVSYQENLTITNFTKSLIFGGIGIAILGLGFAVVYVINLKKKNKEIAEDDTY